MDTSPSSSSVQLREIPRGGRVKLASCFSLVPFGFPKPFSQVGLEFICRLWGWTGLQGWGMEHCLWCGRQWWPLWARDTGPEGDVCVQSRASPLQSKAWPTCSPIHAPKILWAGSSSSLSHVVLCEYRFSLISAVFCAGVRIGVGGRHCWHSAQCSCFCNTHRDLEQFSLLHMLAFKNVTGTLRLAVRGAWFGIKLWLSVISYNLQMAWLAEMLKTVRSYFYSFIN